MTRSDAPSSLWAELDAQRAAHGFLTVSEVVALRASGNVILDPFSTLIGRSVEVGRDNFFYSQVVLEVHPGGVLSIGDGNRFYPQTFLCAEQGQLTVGHGNTFGGGGVTCKTVAAGETLVIEDGGRYQHGACLVGTNDLGAGSQVLGALTVQRCTLGAGEGFAHPDPDARGGVLKGAGTARGLRARSSAAVSCWSRPTSSGRRPIPRRGKLEPQSLNGYRSSFKESL